jgi:ferredoxin-NADP reductase
MIIDPYHWQRCPITSIEKVSMDMITVRFDRPVGYSFAPGQYAVVRTTLPSGEQLLRQYSFTSRPADAYLELLVQREPEGVVTGWFFESADNGDTVELSQPYGNFTFDPSLKRPVLCIAGRVGIAPFLSMLRTYPNRPIHLLYSVREAAQIFSPDELESYDTTVVVTSVSPRIDNVLLAPLLASNPLVYICGSKLFVDAITGYVKDHGVTADDIRRELFTLQ